MLGRKGLGLGASCAPHQPHSKQKHKIGCAWLMAAVQTYRLHAMQEMGVSRDHGLSGLTQRNDLLLLMVQLTPSRRKCRLGLRVLRLQAVDELRMLVRESGDGVLVFLMRSIELEVQRLHLRRVRCDQSFALFSVLCASVRFMTLERCEMLKQTNTANETSLRSNTDWCTSSQMQAKPRPARARARSL